MELSAIQIGRWHRRQNKFGKVWQQTEVTVRLALAEPSGSYIAYFNWIWVHSRKDNTAAQRSGLALAEPSVSYIAPWNWNDLITIPTLC